MKEKRQFERHNVEYHVIDHSEDTARTLDCVDISEGGMKIRGQAIKDEFHTSILVPNSNVEYIVKVKKVYQNEEFFGVEIINAPDKFFDKIV
ncbi:MAG: PilZ domain-containing protein [Pseudomonadota bacterium]